MIFTKDEIIEMAIEKLGEHLEDLAKQGKINEELTIKYVKGVSDTKYYICLKNGLSYMLEITGRI